MQCGFSFDHQNYIHCRVKKALPPQFNQFSKIWFMKLSSVNTVTEEFENAAFILRLGLPSSLICYENVLQIGGFACEPMCTAKNILKTV